MKSRRFIQADVFSAVPTKGNGLAVIVEAEGLSDDDLQTFAAWTNLAETTFLFPPDDPAADYRVRIFTPGREMLFAGHPTLGSCAAWLHCGGQPQTNGVVIQECAIGLVTIDVSGDVPAFAAPPTKVEPLPDDELKALIDVFDLSPDDVVGGVQLDNGPVWKLIEVKDADCALAMDESRVRWPDYVGVSAIGANRGDGDFDYETRNLAPSSGMSEDPITGSLNSAIACWLQQEGRLTGPLTMRQGTKLGRDGRVYVRPDESDGGTIWIGGEAKVLIDGMVLL